MNEQNNSMGGAVQTPPPPIEQPPVPQPPVMPQPPMQSQPVPGQPPVYTQPMYQPAPGGMPMPPVKPRRDIKKMLPLIIGGGAALLVLLIVLVVYLTMFAGKTTIDLSKYYDIEVTGFNGYAKAKVVTIMEPSSDPDLQEDMDSLSSLTSAMSTYSFFAALDEELSKTEGISNGDTIELTFSYSEDMASELDLRIKNDTITKKVEGLAEGKKTDPFATLEVVFDGISPNGTVTLNNNSGDEMIRKIRYSADNSRKLKNGDKIVVTASYDEDYALENGYIITQETKEYTVSGLDYYLDDKTTLSAAHKKTLEKEFTDRIESVLASRWDDIYNDFGDYAYAEKVSIGKPKLVKGYLLSVKDADKTWNDYNKVVMIYQVEINAKAKSTYSSGTFGKRTGYVAVQFSNAGISEKEGAFVTTPTSMYSGYSASAKLADLEDDYVTANKSNYIVTDWK